MADRYTLMTWDPKQTIWQAPNYEGICLNIGPGPVTGISSVPENIPHYWDATGKLLVLAVGFYSDGSLPSSDPPAANQAPGYHKAMPWNQQTPAAKFGSDGICTSAGWDAGQGGKANWYAVGDETGKPSGQGNPNVLAGQALIAQGAVMIQTGLKGL